MVQQPGRVRELVAPGPVGAVCGLVGGRVGRHLRRSGRNSRLRVLAPLMLLAAGLLALLAAAFVFVWGGAG